MGDKCRKTSVNSCSPRHPEWETSVETSVNSCGPRQPEWETSVEDKCGDKCKLMRPKAPRVGEVWETSGRQVKTHAAQGTQSGRQVWEISVGDKCGRQV